mmetsp:Transcript_124536/g.346720  ORF Transcript_124536/g.346720 Transcript_124536/m.346720 type:complete len:276 (+) Transcript_124536:716-1543(+)
MAAVLHGALHRVLGLLQQLVQLALHDGEVQVHPLLDVPHLLLGRALHLQDLALRGRAVRPELVVLVAQLLVLRVLDLLQVPGRLGRAPRLLPQRLLQAAAAVALGLDLALHGRQLVLAVLPELLLPVLHLDELGAQARELPGALHLPLLGATEHLLDLVFRLLLGKLRALSRGCLALLEGPAVAPKLVDSKRVRRLVEVPLLGELLASQDHWRIFPAATRRGQSPGGSPLRRHAPRRAPCRTQRRGRRAGSARRQRRGHRLRLVAVVLQLLRELV